MVAKLYMLAYFKIQISGCREINTNSFIRGFNFMEIVDNGYIITAKPFKENSGLISVFCRQSGIYKGIARNINSRRNSGIYLTGNKIEMCWSARLSEHLGTIKANRVISNAFIIMQKEFSLKLLSSCLSLINITLPERHPEPLIYDKFSEITEELKQTAEPEKNAAQLLGSYIEFELILLKELGFAIDFSRCAASGLSSKDCRLSYVSPKTARAVSAEFGEAYRDKLLGLPSFIINSSLPENIEEVLNALKLSEYFLYRHFFEPKSLTLPRAREELKTYIEKSVII